MAGETGDVRVETRSPSGRVGSGGTSAAVAANGAHAGNGAVNGMIDLEFVRGLIEAIDSSGIDSIEIHRAGTRIRVSKTPLQPVVTAAPAAPAPAPAAPASNREPGAGSDAAVEPSAKPEPDPNLVDVTSPMVGTFYRAPAPEAPAYVEVGTAVTKGQTLCILEAMKLMNELECEVDGVVREILIENADPVEYGEVLFRIEPAGAAD